MPRSPRGRARRPEDELAARELDELVATVRACRICRDAPSGRPLPHEPRPVLVPSTTSRILIAGQAPGTRVHASGKPFTDPSGDRLRDWMGVTEDEFYDPSKFAVLPMGFCFPGLDAHGSDLPPRKECAPAWRTSLLGAMPQIDLVLAIGGYAQAWHVGEGRPRSVTDTVMDWKRIVAKGSPTVVPLPHPSWRNSAWLKRNPWFGNELLPFLKQEIGKRLRRRN
ncbi:MAG: uracil-DNA glycosylase family protein [Rhizobiaceae bacterium]